MLRKKDRGESRSASHFLESVFSLPIFFMSFLHLTYATKNKIHSDYGEKINYIILFNSQHHNLFNCYQKESRKNIPVYIYMNTKAVQQMKLHFFGKPNLFHIRYL